MPRTARKFQCPRCGSQMLKREGQLENNEWHYVKPNFKNMIIHPSERVDMYQCQNCQWCGTEEQIWNQRI